MSEISIFVVTHKKVPRFSEDKDFYLLGVGKDSHSIGADFMDDSGLNIATKNPNYCELTGQYWIWKNVHSEYVGLMHYRRYFYHALSPSPKLVPYSSGELLRLLGKYDVLLPRKVSVHSFSFKTFRYFSKNYYDYYAKCGGKTIDIDTTRKAVEKLYPEYLESYDKVVFSRPRIHYGNVIVTRKEIYDRYSSFVFDVLSEVEKNLDLSDHNAYQARVFGFMSETLMDTFFLTHPEFRIKDLPLCNSDYSRKKNFYHFLRHWA